MCISICTHYGAPSAARGSAHPPMARGNPKRRPGQPSMLAPAHRLGLAIDEPSAIENMRYRPSFGWNALRMERDGDGTSASLCASRRALFVKRGGANRSARCDRERAFDLGEQWRAKRKSNRVNAKFKSEFWQAKALFSPREKESRYTRAFYTARI